MGLGAKASRGGGGGGFRVQRPTCARARQCGSGYIGLGLGLAGLGVRVGVRAGVRVGARIGARVRVTGSQDHMVRIRVVGVRLDLG